MSQKRFEFIKKPSDILKYIKIEGCTLRFCDSRAAKAKNMDFYNYNGIDEDLDLRVLHSPSELSQGILTVENDFETNDEEATEALQSGLLKAYGKKYLRALGKYMHKQVDNHIAELSKQLDEAE